MKIKQLEKQFPVVAELLIFAHDGYLEAIYDDLEDTDNIEELLPYINDIRRFLGDKPLTLENLK